MPAATRVRWTRWWRRAVGRLREPGSRRLDRASGRGRPAAAHPPWARGRALRAASGADGRRDSRCPDAQPVSVRARPRRALPNGWLDAVRQVLVFRRRLLRLPARARRGRRARRRRGFEHARDIIDIERVAAPVHRAARPDVGESQAAGSSTSRAGCTSTRTSRSRSRSLICLYLVPQPLVLLRAQHVHDRDGASRSSATSSSRPRRRASSRSGASRTRSPTSPASAPTRRRTANALFNPFAAVPVACTSPSRSMIGVSLARLVKPRAAQDRLVALPAAHHVRGHRPPANHFWFDAALGAVDRRRLATRGPGPARPGAPGRWAFAAPGSRRG